MVNAGVRRSLRARLFRLQALLRLPLDEDGTKSRIGLSVNARYSTVTAPSISARVAELRHS